MDVCIFSNLHAKKPQKTSLEKIVHIIQTSHHLEKLTFEARAHYAAGHKKNGDKIKKNELPAFAPCAYFLDGKSREDIIGLTGLCFLDIDKIAEDQVDAAMSILKSNDNVLFAARSLSGHGIHILIPYSLHRNDPFIPLSARPDLANRIYIAVYKSISARFRELLQLPTDQQAAHAEHLCLISFDSKAYYNPRAASIVFLYESQKLGKKPKGFVEYFQPK